MGVLRPVTVCYALNAHWGRTGFDVVQEAKDACRRRQP